MRNFWALTRRELLSVFVSPLAYGTAALFMLLFGLFFIGQFAQYKLVQLQTVAEPLGHILPALAAPVLTMRLLAEERRLGTLEMLMTAPVTDFEVVLAKFCGVWLFYASVLALTFLHVAAMLWCYDGPVDWTGFALGYAGLLLIAGYFLAFGLLCSSFFESPILAALTAFVAGLFILLAGMILSRPVFTNPGVQQEILKFMLPYAHYSNLMRGVLDTRDLAYFGGAIGYAIFLATKSLESRKWR
ncbi:MAG: ABC transporter permease [Planctomycetes bacterium]|nr:ABC transporter permease [Planctomycetota bacterium]